MQKSPLKYEELRDVIDISLWAGQMLLHYGAESQRVEETVHRLSTGLGCTWADVLVSPNAIVLTTISGQEFRTKVRRVVGVSVDMTIVAEISDLSRRVSAGQADRFQVRAELERIDTQPRHYNRWLVMLMVGLACAAFSRLFGGDGAVFLATFCSSALAMFVRQQLQREHFNPLLVTVVTAFVAGMAAGSFTLLDVNPHPDTALAASVLLLVPGVPLITSAEDLIEGHLVTGIVRGILGSLISLGIALGLLIAIELTEVGGL
jgi:uncharacterized membrane protein YjjP (DUF1212 family)